MIHSFRQRTNIYRFIKAQKLLTLIERNGQQLLSLVNQMLDLSKLESGHLNTNLEQGDIILFLKYLLESFQSSAATKNIALYFESVESQLSMDFDTEKLRQIISNLIQNAIKFTPEEGRVHLRVKRQQQCLLIRSNR